MKKYIINILAAIVVAASAKAQVPEIITQPQHTLLCSNGGTANFTITANNSPASYGWEMSTNTGETWTKITGNNNNFTISGFSSSTIQFTPKATATLNSQAVILLRGYAINGNGISSPSNAAVLGIKDAPEKPMIEKMSGSNFCVGNDFQFVALPANGTWQSLNPNVATISCCGLANAKASGQCYLTYTYEGTNGCIANSTYTLTINATPKTPSIAYAAGTTNPQTGAGGGFCTNKSFTLVGTPSGGSWSSTGVISVNNSGVVSTGAVPGVATVKYTIADAKGCTNSRIINGSVVSCAARGINQLISQSTHQPFTLYPNPAHSMMNIYVDKLVGNGQVVITDLLGKQIKQQTLSMGVNAIDINGIARGMYFVSIVTEHGRQIEKLIVE